MHPIDSSPLGTTLAPSSRMAVTTNNLWIGTSGWTYEGWRGPFFPETVPRKEWLTWYATQFTTVELNGSFYRIPTIDTVRSWRKQTPDHFHFSWKASKFISHLYRLTTNSRKTLKVQETRLKALGPKLGSVLYQLPPHFHVNRERLAAFIKMLPSHQYTFEFRHQSWYQPAIFELLRENNIALCLSDHRDAPAPWEITASHVYLRAHGPTGSYHDNYPDKTLRAWAKTIKKWRRRKLSVYCYFDNDFKSAAPHDAKRLIHLLSE